MWGSLSEPRGEAAYRLRHLSCGGPFFRPSAFAFEPGEGSAQPALAGVNVPEMMVPEMSMPASPSVLLSYGAKPATRHQL